MSMQKALGRYTSRLVAGLFAVQIVLTGFCMLTPQAHAMPMATAHNADVSAHCSKDGGTMSMSMAPGMGHHHASHSGSCFHCDEPDQFVKVSTADIAPASLILVAVAVMPEVAEASIEQPAFDTLQPTGPPRSSSLLFSTTQRIRV